jgi:glycosyltransferase involved in cell wall biosynthesis
MQALSQLGHQISLASVVESIPEALQGLSLEHTFALDEVSHDSTYRSHDEQNHLKAVSTGLDLPQLGYWQERFRSYWGIPSSRIVAAGRAAERCRADVVVTVGLNGLPFLGGIRNALRVWYALDEWVLHHLALVRWNDPTTWNHIRAAAVKGFYERVYASLWDRVWVVSSGDRRAMRLASGENSIDFLHSGVDSEYYSPRNHEEIENSCVFWGRLDFDPNIRALQWFCRFVWPSLRKQAPDAQFRILGFQPGPEVRELVGRDGISLVPDLPDIRGEIGRHALVVLPFHTRGGVKDKLLEAASMAKAIVCTPQSCGGLRGLCDRKREPAPLILAQSPDRWVGNILSLWNDKNRRRQIGLAAREWVLRNHTWSAMAREACELLNKSMLHPRNMENTGIALHSRNPNRSNIHLLKNT